MSVEILALIRNRRETVPGRFVHEMITLVVDRGFLRPLPTPRRGPAPGVARLGGLKRASMYGPDELTGKARAAFLSRFEREVDPENSLDPTERSRRAMAARKLYMSRLARRPRRRRGVR